MLFNCSSWELDSSPVPGQEHLDPFLLGLKKRVGKEHAFSWIAGEVLTDIDLR